MKNGLLQSAGLCALAAWREPNYLLRSALPY